MSKRRFNKLHVDACRSMIKAGIVPAVEHTVDQIVELLFYYGDLEKMSRGESDIVARTKKIVVDLMTEMLDLGADTKTVIDSGDIELQASLIAGRKVRRAAKLGHEAVHGTKEEKEARYAGYQRTVDDLRARHPEWSKNSIYENATKLHGCSSVTIRRHVTIKN